MTQRHLKRCSVPLIVRETRENHNQLCPHPGQNGCHPQVHKPQCWRGCGGQGALVSCRWECRRAQPRWEAGRPFLKELKVELPRDPRHIPSREAHPVPPGVSTPLTTGLNEATVSWEECENPMAENGTFKTQAGEGTFWNSATRMSPRPPRWWSTRDPREIFPTPARLQEQQARLSG